MLSFLKKQLLKEQIWEHIVKLPDYLNLHTTSRVELFNGIKCKKTFDGRRLDTQCALIAYHKAKNLLPNHKVELINAQRSAIHNEIGDINHWYVSINENEYIITTGMRNLFMFQAGSCKKWNSFYGKILYESLDPIFVGSYEELKELDSELRLLRLKDPYHSIDNNKIGNIIYYFNYSNQTKNIYSDDSINEYMKYINL